MGLVVTGVSCYKGNIFKNTLDMAPIFTLAERLRTFYMSLQAQTWWNAMSPCRRTGVSCDAKVFFAGQHFGSFFVKVICVRMLNVCSQN